MNLNIPLKYKELPEIRGIIAHPSFIKMKDFRHHGNIDCRFHTLRVAEKAYDMAEYFKADIVSTVRGALLHDFYLYDWHEGCPPFHGFRHPFYALKEASKIFSLNNIERDCIKKHMFPLTPQPPVYIESWIVSFSDKFHAFRDYIVQFSNFMKRSASPSGSSVE